MSTVFSQESLSRLAFIYHTWAWINIFQSKFISRTSLKGPLIQVTVKCQIADQGRALGMNALWYLQNCQVMIVEISSKTLLWKRLTQDINGDKCSYLWVSGFCNLVFDTRLYSHEIQEFVQGERKTSSSMEKHPVLLAIEHSFCWTTIVVLPQLKITWKILALDSCLCL